MATTKLLLHPQFFHTLVHGFHTHLTIPLDFFSKYVEGKSVLEKTMVKVKSDSSDITWKVKMTGRRLSDGWEEFAVANHLRIGDVVVVRYEGDLVFHVLDLGPNFCDTTVPSNNRYDGQDDIGKSSSAFGQESQCFKDETVCGNERIFLSSSSKSGKFLLKKHTHPRTDVGNDDEEPHRKKKVKKNSVDETEADSSSLDKSCFVANVTASNLCTYTLARFDKIVLGWRSFCEENGKKVGGFFTFKLVGNGETPVLSFFPTESIDERRQRDCSEASGRESLSTDFSRKEDNIEGRIEKKKCSLKPKRRASSFSSYSPLHKQSVTFTLPPDYDNIGSLTLPKPFLMENGINKAGKIYLLGKDGTH